MMHLTASDFYSYFRPSRCALRVYLRHHNVEEAKAGPYEQVIRMLGQRHERAHLATFPTFVDVSAEPRAQQESLTRTLVADNTSVIYQPMLWTRTTLDGVDCEIVGEPDYLVKCSPGEYLIRDSKISRRITEEDHPEILLQLQLYGWLYQQTFKKSPVRLEVHNGRNEIVEVPNDGGLAALKMLTEIVSIRQRQSEPYSPVGWSKCGACGFHDRCWTIAQANQDVAMVAGVDQSLAMALHQYGAKTVDALVANFDAVKLSQFTRLKGKSKQRVGQDAASILCMAKALSTGKETILATPDIPQCANFVMFDLEGLPPQLDQPEKIYLWGMQVFGGRPGKYIAATGGFNPDADCLSWQDFLAKAQSIFAEYGDLPFVHWHDYESKHIDKYLQRYGDYEGVAARVKRNLLDLLPITRQCVALPVSSYSLKVVEKHVGFERTQSEYGGDWSIAKYMDASETDDEHLRAELMDQIITYNREDLEATWAVFQWLKSKTMGERK